MQINLSSGKLRAMLSVFIVASLTSLAAAGEIPKQDNDKSQKARTVIRQNGRKVLGNNPLMIIDGVKLDAVAFSKIAPDSIKSLKVLSKKGATAIYGNEGSDGAIVVITKPNAK